MVVENTSGKGSASVVPNEIKGWNWGAFFLNWIWAIGNKVWIGLLGLVLGIVMAIILGVKGNEWAWKSRQWESVEQFKRTQRIWAWWGLAIFILELIIALASFPAMRHLRAQAEISQCIGNMQQIGTALELYKMDNRKYPEFIAGPARAGMPIDKCSGTDSIGRSVSLYPEYIKSVSALHCPSSDEVEKFGLSDTVSNPMIEVLEDMGIAMPEEQFDLYPYSSYDFQKPGNNPKGEAHYCVRWSAKMDDPDAFRQLIFRNPPGDTVVTWCSNHRKLDSSGKPKPGSMDIVLFLDGTVKKVPTEKLIEWTKAWKNARP